MGERRSEYRGRLRRAPDVPLRRTVACPKCGAAPYDRCFRLSSRVVAPDGAEFYTARQEEMHVERKPAKPTPTPVGDRAELRRRISKLAGRKLAGNDRVWVRAWAGSVKRTVDELAAKVAELEQKADLPW